MWLKRIEAKKTILVLTVTLPDSVKQKDNG